MTVSVSSLSPRETKKQERKELAKNAQMKFMQHINEGQDAKTAFLNSLKVVGEKYNTKDDSFEKSNENKVSMECTLGESPKCLYNKAITKSINPETVKTVMSLIPIVINSLTSIIDFVFDTIDKFRDHFPKKEPVVEQ